MRANSSIGRGMAAVALLLVLAVGAAPAGAQVPRTLVDFGAPVFPSYEGWYENSDGSITLLVGYFNSNTEEVVDIPAGESNYIEPVQEYEDSSDQNPITTATFSAAGDYVLRVEALDETGDGGGGFQCCWTSALVAVTVSE